MNWNFAQKSATWKVWPLVLYELKFCSKECDMKCVTIGCKACQIDHACLTKTRGHTFHVALFWAKFRFIWQIGFGEDIKEILLKKVRHEKCDPWVYMNWNFAQKSATWNVWPLVLYEPKFCSKKCDMKSVTHGFGIKRYGGGISWTKEFHERLVPRTTTRRRITWIFC